MGSIDRRIERLEEQFASSPGPERSAANLTMKAALDRIAALRRMGDEASDEERAELAEFGRAIKASRKKRRAEEWI